MSRRASALVASVLACACESEHDLALARGRAALEAGWPADAIPDLERAATLDETGTEALLLLARAERESGDPAAAITALARADARGASTVGERVELVRGLLDGVGQDTPCPIAPNVVPHDVLTDARERATDDATRAEIDALLVRAESEDERCATDPLGEALGLVAGADPGTTYCIGGLGLRSDAEATEIETPVRPSVHVRTGRVRVDGGLRPAAVREVLHRHLEELRYCYAQALLRSERAAGRLEIVFTIRADGTVTDTRVPADATTDAGLATCFAVAHRRWMFPEDDESSGVTVPYVLETSE